MRRPFWPFCHHLGLILFCRSEDFVVLAAEAVGVESLDGHVQVQVVNWKTSHMLTRQLGRVAVVAQW